ncbi:unnamed protein product [Dicrocoelium dendriticum]|nr:unnamed protein product [Dicrocoelium dendriticum]
MKLAESSDLMHEATALFYKSFDINQVFEFVMSFIAFKYKAELEDVSDASLKQHIIEQRLPAAFEDCGIMELVHSVLAEMGVTSLLSRLENERKCLVSEVNKSKNRLDRVISELTTYQVNSFGRVVFMFDNRIIDLAKEDEDLEVIEAPTRSTNAPFEQGPKSTWRTLQPSELLIGIKLTTGQPVLCRKGGETWFPGRVALCLPQPAGLGSDDCRTGTANGGGNSAFYKVNLDAAPGSKSEQCNANPASLAIAVSAFDLKQRYPVGARVVSIYRDENNGIGYYSGLIAEPPSERNDHRYLLFFDDGYTQYSPPTEIYRICYQSKENWREASEGSQEFIKRYLAQYPQRPMVRLKPSQTIETELDGKWIQAIVDKVDASLALIRFSPTHSEWIYRGSTRLEPLFSDLNPLTELVSRTHNQRLEVEYGNVDASLTDKSKSRKARKSATGNREQPENRLLRSRTSVDGRSSNLRGSVGTRPDSGELESSGTIVAYLDSLISKLVQKEYVPHKCSSNCLVFCIPPSTEPVSENPLDYKGLNPLEIPFHAGWLRYMLVGYPNDFGRQFIIYNAPCGRQLRSLHEVQHFLDRTNSKLTTDLFSFDPDLCINSEFRAEKSLTNIADISYGKENVPVPCVNSVDNEVPGYIDYIPHRQPIGKVPLLTDDSFIVCCDCTDNCRDRAKCACQQLTAEASSLTNPTGLVDAQAGYRYRRLSQFTVGGIYECNSKCSCDRRCSNRVVQQGLWVRLQVFKTSRKGWGIRALNAIPKGTFLCTYAGAIYDESMAVQEGFDYGDEYQAELDYIETVEKEKEGYESVTEEPKDFDYESIISKLPSKSQSETCITDLEKKWKKKSTSHKSEVDSDSRFDSNSIVSSLSESTATEADDDRASRCSDYSCASSRKNVVSTANASKEPEECEIFTTPKPESEMANSNATPASDVVSVACVTVTDVLHTTDGQLSLPSTSSLHPDTQSSDCRGDTDVVLQHSGETTGLNFNDATCCCTAAENNKQQSAHRHSPQVSKDCSSVIIPDDCGSTSNPGAPKKKSIHVRTFNENDYTEDTSQQVSVAVTPISDKEAMSAETLPHHSDVNSLSPSPEETATGNTQQTHSGTSLFSVPEEFASLNITADMDFSRTLRVELTRISAPKTAKPISPLFTVRRLRLRKRKCGRYRLRLSKRVQARMMRGAVKSLLQSSASADSSPAERKEFKNPPNPQPPLTLKLLRSRSQTSCIYSVSSVSSVRRRGKLERSNDSGPDKVSNESAPERRPLSRKTSFNKPPDPRTSAAPVKNSESASVYSQEGPRSHLHSHRHKCHSQSRRFYPVAQPGWLPARTYFKDENPYIMDAKKMGNLGRYFNHSCNPNVFVQNVFIDSHDPRFPEVAFFTKRNIAVGEEMTWDYGYTVDAVPFKVLYCYCGEPNCRIRLL